MSANKLSEQQKLEIIDKYLTGEYTFRGLAKEYGISKNSISWMIKHRGVIPRKLSHIKRKYDINENFFDNIDTEEKAYILGFLYADGYNSESRGSIRLTLQERDREILEKINSIIGHNKPLGFKKKQKDSHQNYYELYISNKHISERLASLGCFQRKSLLLKFPTNEQVPPSIVRHFIRGYFDGDGSFSWGKANQKYYNISIVCAKDFSFGFTEILDKELNIHPSIITDKRGDKRTKLINFGGANQCKKFLDWLYKNHTIALKRKYDNYIKFINRVE